MMLPRFLESKLLADDLHLSCYLMKMNQNLLQTSNTNCMVLYPFPNSLFHIPHSTFHIPSKSCFYNLLLSYEEKGKIKYSGDVTGLKFESCTCTQIWRFLLAQGNNNYWTFVLNPLGLFLLFLSISYYNELTRLLVTVIKCSLVMRCNVVIQGQAQAS